MGAFQNKIEIGSLSESEKNRCRSYIQSHENQYFSVGSPDIWLKGDFSVHALTDGSFMLISDAESGNIFFDSISDLLAVCDHDTSRYIIRCAV